MALNKICFKCKVEKPTCEFYNSKKATYCKSCHKLLNNWGYLKRAQKKVFTVIYDLDGEVWKDVIVCGIKYNYSISNKGRVKFYSRSVPRLLSLSKTGYQCITLYGYGVIPDKNISVHKLVALHFIPNPDNKPEVNHINCNKNDNNLENLEWVTRVENSQHALKNGLRVFKYGSENKASKKVINLNTGIYYDTIKEASKSCNIGYNYLVNMLSGYNKNITPFIYV